MPTRSRHPGARILVLTSVLAIALAGPATLFAAAGAPSTVAGVAGSGTHRPAGALDTSTPWNAMPFQLDLSRPGDFVAQKNFVQCVGASMQMMLNMIEATDDTSVVTQGRLQNLARSLSGQRPDGVERKGASVVGWTAGLNELGAGTYRTVGDLDLQRTLKMAAAAMRETNRPVGLLVWRGRHAWVMAGFTATADPMLTSDFEVTEVIVLDPLYPYGSKVWGASPKPRQALSIAELGRQFVPRGVRGGLPGEAPDPSAGTTGAATTDGGVQSRWSAGLTGKFVIVMPVTVVAAAKLMNAPR